MVVLNTIRLPARINIVHVIKPRLDQYYPVLDSLMDLNVQQKINTEIYNLVYKLIRDQGYYENPLTEITAGFEVKNNQRDILSISFINYAYSGGAHGLTVVKSLNANIRTGEFYELWNLFKPDSNYIGVISDIIKRQIRERKIPTLEEFESIKPDQDFYIADKCVVIYFQLYELAPYVYGFPCFPISVYELADMVEEDGPLGRMMYGF